jgi:N-acetylglucosaminyldiphosphoundecaprenol N-acetyl-beta-D-mannosaminyltransferase
MNPPATVDIRGIPLTNIALDDVLNAIDAAIVTRTPMRIAFVNADCVNIAARDEAYRHDLSSMDWVFADGIGMKIAGKILGQPVRANVNGTDLFPRLCAELAGRQGRLFLLGAKPGVAKAAAEWAVGKYPGLAIAGCRDGYFREEDTSSVVDEIRASRPDVLLVAMGAPRQEAWIRRHTEATGAIIALAVGGLFDYYSGNIPRAPLWMRRFGLEWVWRLSQEPGRLWRRYLLGNWIFLARVLGDRMRGHVNGKKI